MVDERCWEPRQPQDFVRGVADYQAPPFTRPEQSDSFIAIAYSRVASIFSGTTTTLLITLPAKLVKALSTASTSIATLIAVVLKPIIGGNKTVNGNSINSNTLG